MHPAVALGLAAACFAAASISFRRRDCVLRLMSRLRGVDRGPPGTRRHYLHGRHGRRDMLAPVLFFVLFGVLFVVRAVIGLHSAR